MPYRHSANITFGSAVALLLCLASAATKAADIQLGLIGAPPQGVVHAALLALPQSSWQAPPLRTLQASGDLRFVDVPAGDYAVQLFIDSNGNGVLDMSPRGVPQEPVGFSNDPPLFGGMPTPQAAAFSHGDSNSVLLIRVRQTRRAAPSPPVTPAPATR